MNTHKIRGVSITRFKSATAIPLPEYEEGLMKSSVMKRSVAVGGHKTSVSLENEFWTRLKGIAGAKQLTMSQLIAQIDEGRERRNLSSAIRVYVLEHAREFKNTA
jgi:predicted DNA-binding ribbon-helix-helix protein